MNDDSLDRLLAQRRNAPMPQLPGSFRQGVWREIRQRKSESHTLSATWFGWLLEPLLKPAFAFAALTLAVVMGVGLGSGAHASQESQTRAALDLQVFGSASPALPATLMGYAK